MSLFEIKKSTAATYFFNFKDTTNNKVVLRSEQYKAKSSCQNGIASVKSNANSDGRYERLYSANGKYYFNLKAGNGEIIGTSLMYENSTERDEAIDYVKTNAAIAGTTDLS